MFIRNVIKDFKYLVLKGVTLFKSFVNNALSSLKLELFISKFLRQSLIALKDR